MFSLIKASLNRPVTVLMFYLGCLILGFISLQELPVDLFPSLDYPEITIHTTYPNALPEDVEQNVTRILEEAVSASGNIRELRSQSMFGESFIKARFDWGTDMRYAAIGIRQQIDRISDWLPNDAQRPVVLQNNPQNLPFLTLALSGEAELRLARFAEYIVKRRLEQLNGIAYAAVNGAPEPEIYVEYDPFVLKATGVTTKAIHEALFNNNIAFTAGSIKQGHFRLALRIQSEFQSVAEISETLVFPAEGMPIPLNKIARVYEGRKERESITRINGKTCIGLDLFKEKEGNTILISEQANQVIDQLKKEFPEVTFTVVSDQAEFIRQAVNGIVQAILIGSLLAFLILFLFLKSRKAPLIIGISIPLSIIITFVAMKFSGISLNIISLAGLALGSGMLVDNAIIVLENIQRLREQGKSVKDAALEGTAQVAMPVTASTLTTLAVFLPVIFLKDLSGIIFSQQAATASFSLLASLLCGLTLIPVLYHILNKNKLTQEKLIDLPDRKPFSFLNWLENKYHVSLRFMMHYRKESLLVTAGVFLLVIILFPTLDRNLLPETEQRAVHIDMDFLPGVSMEFIDQQAHHWENTIKDWLPDGLLYSELGKKTGAFSEPEERKKNRATLLVKDYKLPIINVLENMSEMRNPGLNIQYKIYKEQTALTQLVGEASFTIDLVISGESFDVLDSLAFHFIKTLNGYTDQISINSDFFERYPALIVHTDREKLIRYNLNTRQITDALSELVGGIVATQYRDFDRKIKIIYRARPDYRFDVDKILNTPIGTNNYRLGAFVDIKQKDLLNSIDHINQARSFSLRLSSPTLSAGKIAKISESIISASVMPVNYRVYLGGKWQETSRSLNLLLLAFILSIILVYLILAAQFESFKIPFVIIFTVPLAFIGMVPALLISGQSMNIMAAIGFIVVVGVTVNDGIVKIDFIEQLRSQGMSVKDAIFEAGRIRLRPIMMTTVTTILSLMPLALGFGPGASLQQPMAIAIIGGLSVATFLTLLVLPVIYLSIVIPSQKRGQ